MNKDTMTFSFTDDDLDLSNTKLDFTIDEQVEKALEILEALENQKAVERVSGWVRWFVPGTPYGIENLPKHKAFFSSSFQYQETYFSAANRCGKTIAGAFQTACHLLGDYPSWWPGRKFDKPTDGWAVGDNKETCRDIIQKELLGDVGKIGTGMIPADRIEKVVYRPNSGGAVDYVLVKHSSGGTSRLGFKSSEQGIVSFYGTAKDFIWMDELPPADIYSECYLRTMTTNGIMYVTATPLAGLTPLVLSFYNNADFLPRGSEVPGIVKLSREDEQEKALEALRRGEIDQIKKNENVSKAVIVAGWDDAPWLTEDAKRRMLDATPSHLKESRSKGLPSMGSGTIYTIPLEEILVKDFDIPAHWKKVAGMDVGWSATACIWLAQNPDTKEVVVYSEYKRGQAEPLIHASAVKGRGDWIPVAIDPASRGRSQVDGKQLFNLYRELGVKLFAADNAVEAGIYQIQEMLATGRLKFFRSLSELAKEYVVYRRDQKGRVVKENDHCLSGDTVVQTSKGNKKIKELVGTEGEIRTLTGDFVPYTNCRLTQEMADLVEVTFEDGYRLVCTPDHKLLTENGWVEAIDSLRYAVYTMGTTPVQTPEVQNVCNQQLIVSTQPSKSSLESVTTCAVTTSSETVFDSIASCGHTSTEKSLKDTTFITKTMTKPTILQKIWSWFTGLSTCLTTTRVTTDARPSTPMFWLRSGTSRKKAEIGTFSITSTTETNFTSRSNGLALTVVNSTKQLVSALKQSFVQTNASPLTGELLERTTLRESASSAIRLFPLTDIQSKSLARESAERKLVSVRSVNVLDRKEDVYCLEVPDYACFVVENGVVVHNCLDALRYAVMALKHAKNTPIKSQGGQFLNATGKRYDI